MKATLRTQFVNLMSQLEHRAQTLELEAVAKRHAMLDRIRERGNAASKEARVCRARIQQLAIQLNA